MFKNKKSYSENIVNIVKCDIIIRNLDSFIYRTAFLKFV